MPIVQLHVLAGYTPKDKLRLGEAITDGRGKIHSGALEMSNIDMTSELTKLIRAQQTFSGTSRLLQSETEMVRKFL